MSMLQKKDKKVIEGGCILANGGLDTYINSNPVPTTIGGIVAGSTFPSPGVTSTQMWDLLLYWVAPTFSSFDLTGISILECGDSIDDVFQPLAWTETSVFNIAANSIDIDDITGAVNLVTGAAVGGSPVLHNFSGAGAITNNTPASNQFRITGTDKNPTGPFTFTRDYYVYWYWMVYAGTDATTPLAEADIEALSDYAALSAGFTRTYSFSAGDYKYVCYPTTMGTATVFKDTATNLDVPMEAFYLINVTNAQGQAVNYKVHRTTNIIGSAINIAVS